MDNLESRFNKQLGTNIQKLRKNRGLKQSELSEALGLKRTSITNIEKGTQKISLFDLYVIALQLNVTLEELMPQFAQFSGEYRQQNKNKNVGSGLDVMRRFGINKNGSRGDKDEK